MIDFLDELGNFKQKEIYTFDFYVLQNVREKQRSLSLASRVFNVLLEYFKVTYQPDSYRYLGTFCKLFLHIKRNTTDVSNAFSKLHRKKIDGWEIVQGLG